MYSCTPSSSYFSSFPSSQSQSYSQPHSHRPRPASPVNLTSALKLVKTFNYLSQNPRHNSLNSHEIITLSQRYGIKVWQSYLENKIPSAGRMYWVYGPGKNQITVIGVEPHPEDKKNKGYDKVVLSGLPTSN